jgi:hypothetical protein
MLRAEKKFLKTYLNEESRYKYLSLLMKYNPSQAIDFIEDQHLNDYQRCLQLCDDNSIKAHLYHLCGDYKQSLHFSLIVIQEKMDNFKLKLKSRPLSERNLLQDDKYEQLLSSMLNHFNFVKSCGHHFEENERMDHYFNVVEILLFQMKSLKYGFEDKVT